ncbi:DUF2249 domain-containing protein [Paraburkholderia dinghuensis]|uniref:DUF2249 domain-containing protein n=1 Tax=Paraburkholderia dinghuensis TaxID=2305225 RepID=A0A3N6NDH4_9BURK|nr:DUF2249 domain-containing protein [Paraburkholderia dinghuensis]
MNETGPDIYQFDARGVAKRFRHAAIFGALESLDRGETMRFINDHDPLPLLQQIQQRYGSQVQIKYLERGMQGVVIDMVIAAPDAHEEASTAGAASSCCGGGCGG